MCKITAIERYCRKAAGGIRKLELFVPEEVTAQPNAYLGVYTETEPTLDVGKESVILLFDRFSCSLSSTPDSAQPGDFWRHSIRCSIQRNRDTVGLLLLRMRNRPFHIITEDYYGVRMWWPNMRLAATRTIEERFSSRNQFSFEFSRRSQHPGTYLLKNESSLPFGTEAWTDSDGTWNDTAGPWVDPN